VVAKVATTTDENSQVTTNSDVDNRPGIRVGMNGHQIRNRLGVPAGESDDGGFHRLQYVNKENDGFAALYFRDDRLVKGRVISQDPRLIL
jgi:hypothetical protein